MATPRITGTLPSPCCYLEIAFVNGSFLECFVQGTADHWNQSLMSIDIRTGGVLSAKAFDKSTYESFMLSLFSQTLLYMKFHDWNETK